MSSLEENSNRVDSRCQVPAAFWELYDLDNNPVVPGDVLPGSVTPCCSDSDNNSDVCFSPDQAVVGHQLGVLLCNSVLTLSLWRQHQILQVKGSAH